MDFTIYADNFCGVFANQQDAISAVQKAQALLKKSGLLIDPKSINMHLLHPHHDFAFSWLGHRIMFPSCTVKLHQHELVSKQNTPKVWTTRKWDYMLRTFGWVELVLDQGWRRF